MNCVSNDWWIKFYCLLYFYWFILNPKQTDLIAILMSFILHFQLIVTMKDFHRISIPSIWWIRDLHACVKPIYTGHWKQYQCYLILENKGITRKAWSSTIKRTLRHHWAYDRIFASKHPLHPSLPFLACYSTPMESICGSYFKGHRNRSHVTRPLAIWSMCVDIYGAHQNDRAWKCAYCCLLLTFSSYSSSWTNACIWTELWTQWKLMHWVAGSFLHPDMCITWRHVLRGGKEGFWIDIKVKLKNHSL